MLAIAALERLSSLAESVDRPDLYTKLATGLGDLDEQRFLAAIWDLSRDRIDLDTIIARFGYEGPGELSEPSCRVDPQRLKRIAERYSEMPEEHAPDRIAERQAAERAAAISELMAALPRRRRPGARLLNRFAATHIPLHEAGKASYVIALDSARAAASRLGADLCREGRLDDPAGAYYLTYEELAGPPRDFRSLVSMRIEQREAHLAVELPVAWSGQPEPVIRDAGANDTGSEILSDIGVFSGVVEAPARMAKTIDEARTIQSGSILVCNTTDSGWTAVFPLAPDGDLIRLDGGAGTIEVVAE